MILDELRAQGIQIRLRDDDKNLGLFPDVNVTPNVIAIAQKKKDEIISLLKQERSEARKNATLCPQVGSLLTKKLKVEKPGCGCKRYAHKMDGWGVAGCTEKFDEIAEHLTNQAREYYAIAKLAPPLARWRARKHLRDAINACRMSVVWVYVNRQAPRVSGLRYSMRSAIANLGDVKNCVLCGDDPGWFSGKRIAVERFEKHHARNEFGSVRYAKWIDSAIKLQAIIDCPDVTENFLWFYDDSFVTGKTSIIELSRPCASGQLHTGDPLASVRHKWREVRRRTHVALDSRGLTTHDFSTHMPVVFNKTKLQQTMSEFDVRHNARCIESLYMNQHFGTPAEVENFQLQKRTRQGWSIRPGTKILNLGYFNEPAASVIKPMFPITAEHELH